MSESLSVEEKVAADKEEQDHGISDMVKALSIGPVDDEKDKKGKGEEEGKDKDKGKEDEGDKDKKEKSGDKEKKESEDENEDEEEDEEEGGDEEEDEEDKRIEGEEESEKEKGKGEKGGKEDTGDEEDEEEEDEEDKEDEEDEGDAELKLKLEILEAENKILKEGTDKGIKKEDQLGITNIKDLEDVDFIGEDEDMEELAGSKEGLNKLLNAVRTKTIQEMMVVLPNLAANLVNQRTTLQNAVDKFYEDNEDLGKHKDYVGLVAQKIMSDHPGLGHETMFKLVEKTVRKSLNLKKKVEAIRTNEKEGKKGKKRTDDSKPALDRKGAGGGGSARGSKDTRTEVQKDMDSMIKAVG